MLIGMLIPYFPEMKTVKAFNKYNTFKSVRIDINQPDSVKLE
jgi:hypothetical protein